ncbi:hypothetical protein NDU88_002415 [Pleurodeles waltl]|uniref:Uncharacterized protein n=1 Tax=Pleurodeles waltl TaxID=8319 RepID=A0AAV7RFC1_PLEWA|nr:hypothetical protein NDU88_002415 [Pleurodeles waltl]
MGERLDRHMTQLVRAERRISKNEDNTADVWKHLDKGSRLSLFLDFTLAVQEVQQKFVDAKNLLKKLNLKYSMLYPVALTWRQMGDP